MNTENVFELILLAIIAGALIFRLRSVLGTRPDDADAGSSSPPLAKPPKETGEKSAAADPVADAKDALLLALTGVKNPDRKASNTAAEKDISITNALSSKADEIRLKYPDFDLKVFLKGSKAAFEMITGAFAKGDLEELKPLVSENIYNSYKDIISQRNDRKETVEFEIIRFIDVAVREVFFEDARHAKIQVSFSTEQVNVVKNEEGKAIHGSDSFINKVQDLWTFSKDLSDSDPTWVLTATKIGTYKEADV